MSAPFQKGYDPVAHEREIRSLSASSGASPAEVRALFVPEFTRLEMGAKVGSYLAVLTQSNVRGLLRRKASRLAAANASASPVQVAGLMHDRAWHVAEQVNRYSEIPVSQGGRSAQRARGTLQRDLRRWQDDGGAPLRRA